MPPSVVLCSELGKPPLSCAGCFFCLFVCFVLLFFFFVGEESESRWRSEYVAYRWISDSAPFLRRVVAGCRLLSFARQNMRMRCRCRSAERRDSRAGRRHRAQMQHLQAGVLSGAGLNPIPKQVEFGADLERCPFPHLVWITQKCRGVRAWW